MYICVFKSKLQNIKLCGYPIAEFLLKPDFYLYGIRVMTWLPDHTTPYWCQWPEYQTITQIPIVNVKLPSLLGKGLSTSCARISLGVFSVSRLFMSLLRIFWCKLETKNETLAKRESSILVYLFLQHAVLFCSIWLTSCVQFEKNRGLVI